MTLTDTEARILKLLATEPGVYHRASWVGVALWGSSTKSRSPAAYARPAGRLLRRLEGRGLVEQGVADRGRDGRTWGGWRTTARGRVGIKAMDSARRAAQVNDMAPSKEGT